MSANDHGIAGAMGLSQSLVADESKFWATPHKKHKHSPYYGLRWCIRTGLLNVEVPTNLSDITVITSHRILEAPRITQPEIVNIAVYVYLSMASFTKPCTGNYYYYRPSSAPSRSERHWLSGTFLVSDVVVGDNCCTAAEASESRIHR